MTNNLEALRGTEEGFIREKCASLIMVILNEAIEGAHYKSQRKGETLHVEIKDIPELQYFLLIHLAQIMVDSFNKFKVNPFRDLMPDNSKWAQTVLNFSINLLESHKKELIKQEIKEKNKKI